jgi:hypothetical protein
MVEVRLKMPCISLDKGFAREFYAAAAAFARALSESEQREPEERGRGVEA